MIDELWQWKAAAQAEASRVDELKAERDTLRQQLIESEAHLKHARTCIQHMIDQTTPLVPDPNNPGWSKRIQLDDVIAQRDKLAQILRDLVPGCKWRHMRPRIDAALAEVDALTGDSGVDEP